MPHGNNNYSGDYAHPHEKGVVTYTYGEGAKGCVATGSGPATWNHDGTPAGICDLNGNVWEWAGGLRLNEGEINVIPHNNAAKHIDQSAASVQWKGILQDGTFVAPGTANTLKFDASNANGGGTAILSTSIANKGTDDVNMHNTFQTLAAKEGVSVPTLLQLLGIMPPAGELEGDGFWAINNGERLPLRGGNWTLTSTAGVFALNLYSPRANSDVLIGFRAAFVNL